MEKVIEDAVARIRKQYIYELSDDGYEVDNIHNDGDFSYNKNVDLMYTLGDPWCGRLRNKRFIIQVEFRNKIKHKIITGCNLAGIYHHINGKYRKILDKSEFALPEAADDACRLLINSLRRKLTLRCDSLSKEERNCLAVISNSLWSRANFNGLICIRECVTFKRQYFNNVNDALEFVRPYFDSFLTLIHCGNKRYAADVFLWYNGEYKAAQIDLENNRIQTNDGLVFYGLK